MQVVVFGAHEAPRERLALSYTSRRDHLGAECFLLPARGRRWRELGDRSWERLFHPAKPHKPPFSFLRPLCPMHAGFEDEQADR